MSPCLFFLIKILNCPIGSFEGTSQNTSKYDEYIDCMAAFVNIYSL
jgi:hypothetical protein